MSTTPATPQQIACIGAICSKINITKENKQVMVKGFSNGRTATTKELYATEAIQMIRHLKVLDPEEEKCKKMRGKILYYAYLLGWTKTNHNNKIVANVERVDVWMLRYSYLKKKLYSYTYAELPKLVTQFYNMYNSILKKI